nr:uncharacterized protein LOC107063476 [Ipomoea batatas]
MLLSRMNCFSFKKPQKLKIIRVVHLNGHVEDYDYPVSVSEVIGNSNKHLVFTPAQFLSHGSKPLKNSIMLERGQVYFLLPHSTFHAGASTVDLAPIAKKLNAIARSARSGGQNSGRHQNWAVNLGAGSSPVWGSPGRLTGRDVISVEADDFGAQGSTKSRIWKPILETIRERSFNRRSESDLQEKC